MVDLALYQLERRLRAGRGLVAIPPPQTFTSVNLIRGVAASLAHLASLFDT